MRPLWSSRTCIEHLFECRRGDLNPHALAGTSPSSWRVCQFRHSDVALRLAGARGHLIAGPKSPLNLHRWSGGARSRRSRRGCGPIRWRPDRPRRHGTRPSGWGATGAATRASSRSFSWNAISAVGVARVGVERELAVAEGVAAAPAEVGVVDRPVEQQVVGAEDPEAGVRVGVGGLGLEVGALGRRTRDHLVDQVGGRVVVGEDDLGAEPGQHRGSPGMGAAQTSSPAPNPSTTAASPSSRVDTKVRSSMIESSAAALGRLDVHRVGVRAEPPAAPLGHVGADPLELVELGDAAGRGPRRDDVDLPLLDQLEGGEVVGHDDEAHFVEEGAAPPPARVRGQHRLEPFGVVVEHEGPAPDAGCGRVDALRAPDQSARQPGSGWLNVAVTSPSSPVVMSSTMSSLTLRSRSSLVIGEPSLHVAPSRSRKVADRSPGPSVSDPGSTSQGSHAPSGVARKSWGSNSERTPAPVMV